MARSSKGMKIAIALQHLRLDKSATEDSVKLAYRELAKKWHPDKYRDGDPMKPEALRQIQVINEAKTVALKYVRKYGHFLHVRDVGVEEPKRKAPPRPPPGQGAPRAKKQEPPKQKRQQTGTRQAPPKEEPPKKERYQSKPPPRPKSKPKPPPRAEPRPKAAHANDMDEGLSFSDYLPSQTTLVAIIALATIVFFMYSMISNLFNSPMDKFKSYTEQVNRGEVKLIPAKKPAVIDEEELVEEMIAEEEEAEVAQLDTFFTLGSEKEWVSYVQGPPLQIKGAIWRYGFSTITFEGNKVVGWNNSALNPIKVGIITDPNEVYPYSTWGIGSKINDVVALQGPPDVVVDSLWSYGEAKVMFSADTVISWVDDMQNRLNVGK